MDKKRTLQKLNESTRCDFDSLNRSFFTSPQRGAQRRLNSVTPNKGAIVHMYDETRQENISNPTSIFKKMREKSIRDGFVREKGARHREFFKGATPCVNDEDITELCKKYTIKPGDDSNAAMLSNKGTNIQMEKLKAEIKRKQNRMVHECEMANKKTTSDKFNLDLQRLLINFKQEEFMRNQRLLETVNVALPASLKQMYCYALNTELAYIIEGNEVAHDYHEGKFDPGMLKYADPKKLKKKPQKKRIPI